MRTNVSKDFGFNKTNSFKFSAAKSILDDMLAPKPKITIMHAVLYADNIRVDYTADSRQHHVKIMLPKMEQFVLDFYNSSELSDITIYYFLEENLESICQAYLAAGKETTAL